MSLSIGIVGLPNVGKSTVFNALTRNEVLAANYPFATIEPNVGVVAVPDPRLERLADLYHSDRDRPGHGDLRRHRRHRARRLGGRGPRATSSWPPSGRATPSARWCGSSTTTTSSTSTGAVDPATDIATVNTELILADLQTVDQRLAKLAREARMRPELRPVLQSVTAARAVLDQGRTISSAPGEVDASHLGDLHLLTAKPFIYVFNVDEASAGRRATATGS